VVVERGIAVYLPTDVEEVAGSWRIRVRAEPQFAQPLGSDETVRRFWSAPAVGLGLQLLAGLGHDGSSPVACWSGPQLGQIASETLRLEAWWAEADLPYEVLADLREAIACLREAAGIANACGGWVVIA
jgi:hypothetical protein